MRHRVLPQILKVSIHKRQVIEAQSKREKNGQDFHGAEAEREGGIMDTSFNRNRNNKQLLD